MSIRKDFCSFSLGIRERERKGFCAVARAGSTTAKSDPAIGRCLQFLGSKRGFLRPSGEMAKIDNSIGIQGRCHHQHGNTGRSVKCGRYEFALTRWFQELLGECHAPPCPTLGLLACPVLRFTWSAGAQIRAFMAGGETLAQNVIPD